MPSTQPAVSHQLRPRPRIAGSAISRTAKPAPETFGAGKLVTARGAIAASVVALGLALCVQAHAQIVVPPTAEAPEEPARIAPTVDTPLVRPAPPSPSLSGEPLRLQEETRTWYGYQNFLLMAGSLLVAGLGATGFGAPAFYAGVAGFYLGPPIVHASHGNVGTAFASLGVGVGGAVVSIMATGLVVGAFSEPCRSECGLETFGVVLLGGMIGGLIYAVVDIGFLAYDVQKADEKRPADTSSFRLMPKVWFAQNQTTFGLSGEF